MTFLGQCRFCQRPERDHTPHAFEPVDVPEGCVCDPRDWGGAPGKVCGIWEPDPTRFLNCDHCEHERECHAAVDPPPDPA